MIVVLLLALIAVLGLCIAANQIRIADTDCEVSEDAYGDVIELPSHEGEVNRERL